MQTQFTCLVKTKHKVLFLLFLNHKAISLNQFTVLFNFPFILYLTTLVVLKYSCQINLIMDIIYLLLVSIKPFWDIHSISASNIHMHLPGQGSSVRNSVSTFVSFPSKTSKNKLKTNKRTKCKLVVRAEIPFWDSALIPWSNTHMFRHTV